MMNNNTIDVYIVPHPFRAERERHAVTPGASVAEILTALQPDTALARHAHVYLNDAYVPQDQWTRVKPKAGTQLGIRMVPMGGGGAKNPLRAMLSVAITAGTQGIAGPLGGVLGVGGIPGLGHVLTGGLNLLGSLVLNALIPPPKPRFGGGTKESPTLFIQGARNEVKPFGRVPKVLGRHRFIPPLGALPYTETVGSDQYLRMLFVWGYGPLSISDLKIGETPLSDFTDVEIETREGYDDDAPITLYSDSVLQNDLQVALTAATGYVSRTTEEDADEISVDITFPNGLFRFSSSGGKSARTVEISVDYAPAGSGDWTSAGTLTVTAKQGVALRKGLRFTVDRGQYDVRLKRLTADSTSDSVFDETAWTALRTIRHTQPIVMTGLAVTALRIKATDQLNGVIDRFNGVVESIVPDWTGTEWTEQATSNPASLFRHVLQGSANARPLADSRLDLDKIQAWHESCSAAGREFNTIIDYDVSVSGVLQDIAAIGRATPTLIDGKWAVVEDKAQTVPVQHFTPRNTFGFKGNKSFDERPEGLRIRFVNADKGWLQDERLVFDDGYDAATATKYETLEMPGITSGDQAWKEGRYHIAAARLRPETYSFYADIEHIVCTRGDLIRFTHDVPMFGLMSGRIKEISESGGYITDITLDAAVTMETGTSYAVRFRLADGSTLVQSVVTAAGTTETLTLTTPCAVAAGPEVGDLALFGESGQESVELIVKSIAPQGDLKAQLTCIDAAPAVYDADTGTIPAFDSHITAMPASFTAPAAPVLVQVQSGEEAMIRQADGSLASRIVMTLQPPVSNTPLRLRAMIRAAGATDYGPASVIIETASSLSITDVEEGGIYDIQVRYVTEDGVPSPPLTIADYVVEGGSALPSDVTNLNMNVLGNTAYLSWDAVTDIDLAHYTLRFAPQTSGVTWASATDLVTQIAKGTTSLTVPAAVGTFLIKAVDAGGRQSANEDAVVSTVAGLAGFNAVETVTEDDDFTGDHDGVGVSDGVLVLAGADSIDDWDDIDAVDNTDVGDDGIVDEGTYDFANAVDLGDVYTSRLTLDMTAAGRDTAAAVDAWGDIDSLVSWDQSVDPSLWDVAVELRTTDDDPAGTPTWSGWMPFVIGDYTARAFEFRAILSSDANGVTPAISRLRVDVDMPDRTESARNITSSAAGTAVTFDTAFHATPAISVTAQNMATGDYFAITSPSATGFTIRFFNAAGTGVVRTFDYLAKGYGQQN